MALFVYKKIKSCYNGKVRKIETNNENMLNLIYSQKKGETSMGCLGYVILGLVVLWLLDSFTLGQLLVAGIVGWIVYKIFFD